MNHFGTMKIRMQIGPSFHQAPGFRQRLSRWLAAGILIAGPGAFGIVTAEPLMRVTTDAASGQTVVLEGDTRVLRCK